MGKSDVCNMLSKIGALDKSVINGNTILLKISEENNKNICKGRRKKRSSCINNDHVLQ